MNFELLTFLYGLLVGLGAGMSGISLSVIYFDFQISSGFAIPLLIVSVILITAGMVKFQEKSDSGFRRGN